MQSFADLNKTWLSQIDPELSRATRAAHIRDAFAKALETASGSPDTARYLLSHIQGVYIVRDEMPQKGAGRQTPVLLKIYSDDSTVRAELDARQEWIRMDLARQGITYDRMRLFASTFGMRQRKPFAKHLEKSTVHPAIVHDVQRHQLEERNIDELASHVSNKHIARSLRRALQATSEQAGHADLATSNPSSLSQKDRRIMVERLEVLKRAICLVFGINADSVLAKINAAYLYPATKNNLEYRERYQRVRCVLYATDERFESVMQAYGDQVVAEAQRLGLFLQGAIRVMPAPQHIASQQAFPQLANPRIVDLHESDRA